VLELNEFFESKEQGRPFLVFGMPRSMTAWISCFLTCGKVFCQHELSGKLDSPQEIADSIRQQPFPFSGLADPGALMIWRELTELLPDATLVYIRREPKQSRESLAAAGDVDSNLLLPRYAVLIQHATAFCLHAEPKILEFHTLTEPDTLRQLWGWCAGDTPLPESHLTKMMTLRVTQKDEIIQAAANSPQKKGAFKW
jgi:hypothetical protein